MTITVADMELHDLLDVPAATSSAIANLRERAGELLAVMEPRVVLSDGSRGYRARAQTTVSISPVIDGQVAEVRESITLECSQSEICVHDPVLTLDGALRIDLEVLTYIADGESKLLGDQPVRFKVGRYADSALAPTYGRLEIPLATDFGSVPVQSTQLVNFIAETPIGKMRNSEPVVMRAMVTKIPPVGIAYVQEGAVKMFGEDGVCAYVKDTTTSMLVELLD